MAIDAPYGPELTRSIDLGMFINDLSQTDRLELSYLMSDQRIDALGAFVEDHASGTPLYLIKAVMMLNDPIRDAIVSVANLVLTAELPSTGFIFLQNTAADEPAVMLAEVPTELIPFDEPGMEFNEGDYDRYLAVLVNFPTLLVEEMADTVAAWIAAKGTVADVLAIAMAEQYDEVFGGALTMTPGPFSFFREIGPEEWPTP